MPLHSWDAFSQEKIIKIFQEKKEVIDIGGGLRISKDKGNRFDKSRTWILPYVKPGQYKILDPVDDYKPDIVGDIHHLPFADNSREAILCIAVLEHVEDPIRACQEMLRVLQPGGYCFIYVPFLYYYHAHQGYYKDYWRFTKDTFEVICKGFSHRETHSVRGALATWLHISPLGKSKVLVKIFHFLDKVFHKEKSNQTSGYYVFLIK